MARKTKEQKEIEENKEVKTKKHQIKNYLLSQKQPKKILQLLLKKKQKKLLKIKL